MCHLPTDGAARDIDIVPAPISVIHGIDIAACDIDIVAGGEVVSPCVLMSLSVMFISSPAVMSVPPESMYIMN